MILSELGLPEHSQSIRRIQIGGLAGGDKYLHDGILFKRPEDPKLGEGRFMYGGKEANQERAV